MTFYHVKLSTIVEDHYPRDPKVGDDILLNKLPNFGYGECGDGLDLYTFGEVVHCDEQIFVLACGFRNGPNMSMPQVANSRG